MPAFARRVGLARVAVAPITEVMLMSGRSALHHASQHRLDRR